MPEDLHLVAEARLRSGMMDGDSGRAAGAGMHHVGDVQDSQTGLTTSSEEV
jgi:hypothetical protein